ncbi:MAG: methionine--tRNA ligase subunit beta, partial [Planctomycetota bacterium]
LTPGAPLPAPEILFPKLADAKRKESHVSDAPDAPQANTPDPKDDPPAPASDLITIDDFLKVKLRTAKVLKVEKHPNADRLLKIQVDLGDEQRQIVAGIAAHYTPEQLEGKNVIVVANLKPAKLRGEVSNGMLLAASDGDKVIVLSPSEDCAPGSGIK